MGKVPVTIQAFLENLSLTEEEDKKGREQRDLVVEHIKQELSIKTTFISGSFGRHTNLSPLHDIDLFLELEPNAHGGPESMTPRAMLSLMSSAVKATKLGRSTKTQGRSVNIEFAEPVIGYDLVPAFDVGGGVYKIPDLSRRDEAGGVGLSGEEGVWLPTNPRLHEEFTKKANKRAEGMALGLIRAVKHWNFKIRKPLRSFHVEVMVGTLLQSKPDSYAEGLRMLFDKLRGQVEKPCPDPANLSGFVNAGTPRAKIQRAEDALESAYIASDKACALEARGDHEGANKLWRQIFGDVYPEAGAEPKVAPMSIDAPKSRFG